MAGRVFILVHYSDDVLIGNRGFLPEEKANGLVLVFNKRMNFTWDDEGISTTLVFGTAPEKCFIPQEQIGLVFSPDLNVQLSLPVVKKEPDAGKEAAGKKKETAGQKVVPIDFHKKKK